MSTTLVHTYNTSSDKFYTVYSTKNMKYTPVILVISFPRILPQTDIETNKLANFYRTLEKTLKNHAITVKKISLKKIIWLGKLATCMSENLRL